MAATELAELVVGAHGSPRVSLYQPTHRSFPDNQQDPIRFRNLLKEVEASLGERAQSSDIQAMLATMRDLAADEAFWSHALDGVAVFAAPGFFRALRLQRPVSSMAIVAESYHVKPLLRILQSAGRFQVLALNRRSVRLFEGDRDVLDEVPLAAQVPATIDQALQEESGASGGHPQETGAAQPRSGGAGERIATRAGTRSGGVHRSHLDVKDAANLEVERFFRAVDRAVTEHHSRPSGLPLILAALPEYHSPFHALSHNPQLLADSIGINPESLSADALREKAWEILLPAYESRLAGLVDRFGAAMPVGRASDRLEDVALAAAEGRIDTLLVDASRKLPGRLKDDGRVVAGDLADSGTDDLIDDLAERVLRTGGDVVVVPTERMPSTTGMVALLRY
jgi:hypothetical protein